MANCTYCGKPAGLFRHYHAECRAEFERAATTIPIFFEKLLQSLLPADRFQQLLKEVSATFHINPTQLKSLSITGINAMVEAALRQHLLTIAEEDRILEVATALGFSSADIPGLEDKLLKIGILRDIEQGNFSDRVTVVGPMPFELEPDEIIVWIFNRVKTYRQPTTPKTPAPPSPASQPQREIPNYFSAESLGQLPAPTDDLMDAGEKDLMLTNRHIFIVGGENHRKIAFSRVGTLNAYSNGFQISRSLTDDKPLTFIMDDPWFAANLIVRLMRSSPNIKGRHRVDAEYSQPTARSSYLSNEPDT